MLQHQYYFENDNLQPVTNYQPTPKSYLQVYEVIRVIEGVPLFLEAHLKRLEQSLFLAQGQPWLDTAFLKHAILQLIEANQTRIGNIKLVLGWNEKTRHRKFQSFFVPHAYPKAEDYQKGVSTDLLFAERTTPNAKIDHTPVRTLANKMIHNQQLFEVLLVDHDGYITEGSRSNCFLIKKGMLYTAPIHHILPGITRQQVFRVCKKLGIPIHEHAIHHEQLTQVDALFITGTSPGVLPIRLVGKRSFSVRFPLLAEIRNAYEELVQHYIEQFRG